MAEVTLPQSGAAEKSAPTQYLTPLAIVVAATGLVALCAHVSVPLLFTPVPVSLAPLAVLFLGLVLGPRMAFATLCLYLAEGAAGLPVFSPQGPGGIAQLLGPTGGYLLSYPFAAACAAYLYPRARQGFPRALVAAGTAGLIILTAGAFWLKLLTHMDIPLVLAQAVAPFLPGDILKVCIAAGAAKAVRAFQTRRRDNSVSGNQSF